MLGETLFQKMREPVNGLTHFFAGVAMIGGLVALLVVGRDDAGKQLSLLIYGLCLLLMLFSSAAYHLIEAAPETILKLRKLDHSAIYFSIAGTYTPLLWNQFAGFWQWKMLAIVWALAIVGVVGKLFIFNTPRWLTAGIYVLMGWSAVFMIGEMFRVLQTGELFLLFLGGAFYTFGAIVYATKIMNFRPGVFGFHEVWHIFVILGALSHYLAILLYVAPSAA